MNRVSFLKYSEAKGLYYCYKGKFSGEEYVKRNTVSIWHKVIAPSYWGDVVKVEDLPPKLRAEALLLGIEL